MGVSSRIALSMMFLCAAAFAQGGADARIELDTPEIPWHKAITFSIIAEAPATAGVTIQDMKDRFAGLVPFGPPELFEEALPEGRKRVTHRYTLEAPEAKAGTFQPQPAIVTISNAETISVPSPLITVRELTPDEDALAQRFAPALEPLNVPRRIWEYWQFWAGIAAAVLIATALFAFFVWRSRTSPATREPMLSPWETALARLAALESKGIKEPAMLGAFYVELSAILRQYIEDRFAIHAPERTTPEFLAEASIRGVLNDDQQRMLAVFLRYSDRVKFARHEPTVEEANRNLGDVRAFVEQTIPSPAPEREAAA
ncbi:MAG: hypothetical protein SGI88_11130 [Candidatus Hydrogenedentes bacterium]|nr:hypothetical protein [Candidatus Hydrogenedentota bacterium]